MFLKPSLKSPAQGRMSGAGGVPGLLGSASTKICWHHCGRDSPCQWLSLGLLVQQHGDIHWCKAHLGGGSGDKQSSGRALRQSGCTRRRSAGHRAQALHPTTTHSLEAWSLAILEDREDVEMSGFNLSTPLGREEGLNQTGGLFFQCYFTAETYCSNVCELKLS